MTTLSKHGDKLSKKEWISRFGLNDYEALTTRGWGLVRCDKNCADTVCHGWRLLSPMMFAEHPDSADEQVHMGVREEKHAKD